VLGLLLAAVRGGSTAGSGDEDVEAVYHAPTLGVVPFAEWKTSRAVQLADFSRRSPPPAPTARSTNLTNLTLMQMTTSRR
jgi:hypothetical protein